ncbi:hypothetical protein MKEN_00597900 [Mycena kentingensis (nom. inval.)]|nr:hypothetical protein MKEN_00597900 [Mycena kentingensis (nom. inval.)]
MMSSTRLALATVHRGIAFEERSMQLLQQHLSMSLRRVGGRDDGGVDLMGWWWLPTPDFDPSARENLSKRRRIRVLAQCKAEKKKPGPHYIRELEGVLHRHISSAEHPLVALFVSTSPFTKATLLRAQSSPAPIFLLHLPPETPELEPGDDGAKNAIGTAVWNPALAGSRGLLGGKIEARWERSVSGSGRPGLWWSSSNYRLPSWTPDACEVPIEDAFDVHMDVER